MKQRVKNISYLTKTVLNLSSLSTEKTDIVAIPLNAEILHISIEITQAGDGGLNADFHLGSQEVGNDIDLSTKGTKVLSYVGTSNDIQSVSITPSTKATQGEIIVRVMYFLPSEITAEY